MRWNYTKSWFFLGWGAIAVGMAVHNAGGHILGVIVMLPICVAADYISYRKHRSLPPEHRG